MYLSEHLLVDILRGDHCCRAVPDQAGQPLATIRIGYFGDQRRPSRHERCSCLRQVFLLGEPEQCRPAIRLVVGQRLGVCADTCGMKVVHRVLDTRPAGRNDVRRAVQVHADLAQRTRADASACSPADPSPSRSLSARRRSRAPTRSFPSLGERPWRSLMIGIPAHVYWCRLGNSQQYKGYLYSHLSS